MQRPKPMMIAAIAAFAVLLIVAILLITRGSPNQDRLGDEGEDEVAAGAPAERCAARATYDAIKRELFRQASRVRGSDQAAFDQVAAYSVLRVERPVVRSDDPDLGTVGCAALATLDLPPGLAVAGGRRSLSAQVGYIVQGAADGSGDVVMLEGADPIIVPLATLARVAVAPAPPVPEPGLPVDGNAIAPVAPAPPVAPVEPASEGPSFDCAAARTRGELAVCRDPRLAALDRQMAAQFVQGLGAANAAQRRLLQSTRDRFLRFRDACGNDRCVADAYRGRMREIDDILADRWQPPR